MVFNGLDVDVQVGNNLFIDERCSFFSSKIKISGTGNSVHLGRTLSYNKLIIHIKGNNKKIFIGESSKKITSLKIVSSRGNDQNIIIGDEFGCGGCEIQMNDGNENLIIGKDCLFSWGIKIRTSDGHSIIDLKSGEAVNLPKDVTIGNHVWVGEDARFLKGAGISNDCVVGSGAVVTKRFMDSNVVIAGFPAVIVKKDITWDRQMPSKFNSKI